MKTSDIQAELKARIDAITEQLDANAAVVNPIKDELGALRRNGGTDSRAKIQELVAKRDALVLPNRSKLASARSHLVNAANALRDAEKELA